MITVQNVSLRYGKRVLFDEVNIKFVPGNCYGIIGANGAGKSTFLKILSGEIEPQTGGVSLDPGERLAVLKQDQFQFDQYTVMDTVILGHQRLYQIMKEREAIYAKEDFSDEDGEKAAELEAEFADLNGWEAESEASQILSGLGVAEAFHYTKMEDLNANDKVKVLLAQALFGNPDVLLLDEPTNDIDVNTLRALEEGLEDFAGCAVVISHDRWFLDRIATHILAFEGNSQVYFFEGTYSEYEENKKKRLGDDTPHRIKYRKLME